MHPSALPEGWQPAINFFLTLTPEQLREKGLPDDREALRKNLRYIYTDGSGFVFYKGQFLHPDVVNRWVDSAESSLSFTPMGRLLHSATICLTSYKPCLRCCSGRALTVTANL